jgi:hypothetical protein
MAASPHTLDNAVLDEPGEVVRDPAWDRTAMHEYAELHVEAQGIRCQVGA